MKKDTIVILAGTRPHAELIKNLNKRGFRTVLIDYTENPIAKEYADVHYVESTLDVEAVERIAREENACRIMDICIDRPIPVAAYVAQKLSLPHPISYESSLVATNKNLMKRFMLDNGIPTSRFVSIQSTDELSVVDLQYPLIVKPSDASGSIGIERVDDHVHLLPAAENALNKSRNSYAIVEEYIVGKEIQIDCFIEDKVVKILDIKSKRMINDNDFSLPYGSIIPALDISIEYSQIEELCARLTKCLGIQNGPLYIQAIVSDNNISVIEFGIRFGGGLSFMIIKDVAGIDIVDSTVEAYLGGHPKVQNNFPSFKGVYATYHIFPGKGIFKAITGYEDLAQKGFFEYFAVNMQPHHECQGGLTSNERAGAFILRADNIQELNNKLRIALDSIDVIDVDGNSIMRKDIYHLS